MQKQSLKNKVLIWPAVIVCLISLVWLAAQTNILNTTLPIGPIGLFAAALALLIYEYKNAR